MAARRGLSRKGPPPPKLGLLEEGGAKSKGPKAGEKYPLDASSIFTGIGTSKELEGECEAELGAATEAGADARAGGRVWTDDETDVRTGLAGSSWARGDAVELGAGTELDAALAEPPCSLQK